MIAAAAVVSMLGIAVIELVEKMAAVMVIESVAVESSSSSMMEH